MKIGVQMYDWRELFPKGIYQCCCRCCFLVYMSIGISIYIPAVKSNAGAIAAIWAPIIVVSFSYPLKYLK